MAFTLKGGPIKFSGGMDDEGHREYKVTYLVTDDAGQSSGDKQNGPAAAMKTPGLPAVGATYAYGSGAEFDLYAWRKPGMEVEEYGSHEPGDFPYQFAVTVTFSTKPRKRDQERPNNSPEITDPLLEPQKVNGSFLRQTEQGLVDRFGKPIRNSAWEQIQGQANEWDSGLPTVTISQNRALLEFPLVSSLLHSLNASPLWGFPVRSIKLSQFSWEKHYGKLSSVYYTRNFTFEINLKPDTVTRTQFIGTVNGSPTITGLFGATDVGRPISGSGIPVGAVITAVTGGGLSATISANATATSNVSASLAPQPGGVVGNWDRDIVDQGTKVLRGSWSNANPPAWVLDGSPSPLNPKHFIRFQDPKGNIGSVVLNGQGVPYDPDLHGANPGMIRVEKYPDGNFLALAIPIAI